jgi:hypothetical protein
MRPPLYNERGATDVRSLVVLFVKKRDFCNLCVYVDAQKRATRGSARPSSELPGRGLRACHQHAIDQVFMASINAMQSRTRAPAAGVCGICRSSKLQDVPSHAALSSWQCRTSCINFEISTAQIIVKNDDSCLDR